jgi:hypothetical protein
MRLAPVLLAPVLLAVATPAFAGGTTLRFGDIKVSDITLQKVKNSSARSGYVFVFRGTVTNGGNEELTRASAIGKSVGSCLQAKSKDNKGRKFDVSCDIPPLLPSETKKNYPFAQSTALADASSAELCLTWYRCTSQLKAKK